jgi:hypothetical protein
MESQVTELGRFAHMILKITPVLANYYPVSCITNAIRIARPQFENAEHRLLKRIDVELGLKDPIGAMIRGQANLYSVKAIDYDLILEGLIMRNWAAEISERKKWIDEQLVGLGRRNFYDEVIKQKIEFIFTGKRYNSTLDSKVKAWMLKRAYQTDDILTYVDEVSALRKRMVFKNQILARTQDYGYVKRVYYVPKPDIWTKGPFAKVYVFDPSKGSQAFYNLGFAELDGLLARNTLNDLLETADKENRVICFHLPLRFNEQKFMLAHDFSNATILPFTLTGDKLISYGEFTIYYQLKGDIYQKFDRTPRLPTYPRIVPHVNDLPYKFYSFDELINLVTDMPTYTSNLELIDRKTIIERTLVQDFD